MTPVAVGQLTDKQEKYCEFVIAGVEPNKAAELAGYAGPDQAVYQLGRNPKVVARISEAAGRQVAMASGLAVKTLVELLDAKNPPQTRLGAAKTILDRAGVVEKTNGNNDKGDGRTLLDLTESELVAMQQNLDGLRSSIDNALHPNVIDHQPIEIIDEDTTPSA